jgi:glycine dehydrogenase
MLEPKESESKTEIDRFIKAMIAIRFEISDIETGRVTRAKSPLAHASHH